MPEIPRDPLAEHPIAPDPAPRRPGSRATLELFPSASEKPFGRPEAPERDPGSAPAVPAEPARDRPPAPPPFFADPEPKGGDLEAPRAVAFARRVAAGLADLLVLALMGAVELAAGAVLLDLRFPPSAFVPLAGFLLLAALVLLVLAPFVWGTTPGMALADLKIRAEDGGSPTLSAAFLRFAGFLLTGALAGVPLLVAAFDRRGRTLADLISRTTIEPVEAAERPDLV